MWSLSMSGHESLARPRIIMAAISVSAVVVALTSGLLYYQYRQQRLTTNSSPPPPFAPLRRRNALRRNRWQRHQPLHPSTTLASDTESDGETERQTEERLISQLEEELLSHDALPSADNTVLDTTVHHPHENDHPPDDDHDPPTHDENTRPLSSSRPARDSHGHMDPYHSDHSSSGHSSSSNSSLLSDDIFSSSDESAVVPRTGQNIVGLLFRVSEDNARRNASLHRGCQCNGCNMVPIRGIRYRCANCADFDLCETCEAQDLHTKTHIFYKIKVPLSSVGHGYMQPVWYTGDADERIKHLPRSLIAKYTKDTGLERHELDAYWEQWTYMANTEWREDPDGLFLAMDRPTFEKCLVPSGAYRYNVPNLIYDRMFSFYDTNQDGLIGFAEFLHGLMYRTRKDRLKRVFDGYDIDGDGYVDRRDFLRMFRAYYQLFRQMHHEILDGWDQQVMASTETRELVEGRQPLSSLFGREGRLPSPDFNQENLVRKDQNRMTMDTHSSLVRGPAEDPSRLDLLTRLLGVYSRNRRSPESAAFAQYSYAIHHPPTSLPGLYDIMTQSLGAEEVSESSAYDSPWYESTDDENEDDDQERGNENGQSRENENGQSRANGEGQMGSSSAGRVWTQQYYQQRNSTPAIHHADDPSPGGPQDTNPNRPQTAPPSNTLEVGPSWREIEPVSGSGSGDPRSAEANVAANADVDANVADNASDRAGIESNSLDVNDVVESGPVTIIHNRRPRRSSSAGRDRSISPVSTGGSLRIATSHSSLSHRRSGSSAAHSLRSSSFSHWDHDPREREIRRTASLRSRRHSPHHAEQHDLENERERASDLEHDHDLDHDHGNEPESGNDHEQEREGEHQEEEAHEREQQPPRAEDPPEHRSVLLRPNTPVVDIETYDPPEPVPRDSPGPNTAVLQNGLAIRGWSLSDVLSPSGDYHDPEERAADPRSSASRHRRPGIRGHRRPHHRRRSSSPTSADAFVRQELLSRWTRRRFYLDEEEGMTAPDGWTDDQDILQRISAMVESDEDTESETEQIEQTEQTEHTLQTDETKMDKYGDAKPHQQPGEEPDQESQGRQDQGLENQGQQDQGQDQEGPKDMDNDADPEPVEMSKDKGKGEAMSVSTEYSKTPSPDHRSINESTDDSTNDTINNSAESSQNVSVDTSTEASTGTSTSENPSSPKDASTSRNAPPESGSSSTTSENSSSPRNGPISASTSPSAHDNPQENKTSQDNPDDPSHGKSHGKSREKSQKTKSKKRRENPWGIGLVPEIDRDAGKEVLYQVAQEAFNELLNILFAQKESMAVAAARQLGEAQKDEDMMRVFLSKEFREWRRTGLLPFPPPVDGSEGEETVHEETVTEEEEGKKETEKKEDEAKDKKENREKRGGKEENENEERVQDKRESSTTAGQDEISPGESTVSDRNSSTVTEAMNGNTSEDQTPENQTSEVVPDKTSEEQPKEGTGPSSTDLDRDEEEALWLQELGDVLARDRGEDRQADGNAQTDELDQKKTPDDAEESREHNGTSQTVDDAHVLDRGDQIDEAEPTVGSSESVDPSKSVDPSESPESPESSKSNSKSTASNAARHAKQKRFEEVRKAMSLVLDVLDEARERGGFGRLNYAEFLTISRDCDAAGTKLDYLGSWMDFCIP